MVASASNNLVLINDLETGEAGYDLDRGGLTDISFSSDGSRVVVIDQFGTALVIDPELGSGQAGSPPPGCHSSPSTSILRRTGAGCRDDRRRRARRSGT